MKCSKCDTELIEDNLICARCGAEIQIVPDFEPELEESISEVLLTVAEELSPDMAQSSENADDLPKKTWSLSAMDAKKLRALLGKWKLHLITALVALVVVTAAIIIIGRIVRENSAPYQIELAAGHAAEGDFTGAIAAMEKADALRPGDFSLRFLLAEYYYLNQDPDGAVRVLLSMLNTSAYTWAEQDECYGRIIEIWSERGDFADIADLLIRSRDADLIAQYQHYLSEAPTFSEASGTFDEDFRLIISAGSGGRILYSLDGKDPDANSIVYVGPITFTAGDYSVAAVFENEYGILSDVTSHVYFIEPQKAPPPQISLDSGLYVEASKIIVDIPPGSTVYYSTDGSIPDAESRLYAEPINMPLGISDFNFIAIYESGPASAVVTRNYEYRLPGGISPEEAADNVLRAQIRRGQVLDESGRAADGEGYYLYKTEQAVEISGQGLYYMVIEYYREGDARPEKTGHIYAAHSITGEAAHLVHDEEGRLVAVVL